MSFSHFLDSCRSRIDKHLNTYIQRHSTHLYLQEAMQYSVFNGGKRVRPILTYAAAEAIHDMPSHQDQATHATNSSAAAVELIHAYSLIHDDLPAMDDDDLRRGKPTCHIAFNEATAILAGDALQALAFETLSLIENFDAKIQLQMLRILGSASGANGMVAGQSVDLEAVDQQLNLEQLEQMHQLKTGALINASIQLGALSTGIANEQQLTALRTYANAVGLAFQVQDDILDVTTDTATLGKPQGADAERHKPTYVSILGVDQARKKAAALQTEALDALGSFDYRADNLRHLAAYIVQRKY